MKTMRNKSDEENISECYLSPGEPMTFQQWRIIPTERNRCHGHSSLGLRKNKKKQEAKMFKVKLYEECW